MRASAHLRALAVMAVLFCHGERAASAEQGQFNTRFVAIGFHDVTDPGQATDVDSVSVAKLVAFLDWLKADGWTVISPADVTAAAQGRRSLPPKAIVLGFDDGYESFYTRVYPLLLAYHYHAMLSLVGQWMDQPPGAMVDYGGQPVPRENFVTWDQVRRMQASGLVEVASHTYDMHRRMVINRQGNVLAPARAWLYDSASDHTETDQEHRARIRADLAHSRELIARETGVAPHVLVWPFGFYSGAAVEEAQALGFDQIYNLSPQAADARDPLNIPRYYPTRDPDLGEIADNLKFNPPASPDIRVACVDISSLAEAHGLAEQDALLGRMVENLRKLGPNVIVIDAMRFSPDGFRPIASWTPTSLLPVEADILSRAARQLGSRGGVEVYVRLRLPVLIKAFGEEGVMDLARQVARGAPIRGIALDGGGGDGSPGHVLDAAEIRSICRSANAGSPLMLRVMHAAMEIDPEVRLMVLASANDQAGPPEGADMIVWPAASSARDAVAQATRLQAAGSFRPGMSGRILLGVPQLSPAHQVQAIRAMQANGANALVLCPWVPADSGVLAPAFSAASFPHRP